MKDSEEITFKVSEEKEEVEEETEEKIASMIEEEIVSPVKLENNIVLTENYLKKVNDELEKIWEVELQNSISFTTQAELLEYIELNGNDHRLTKYI